MAASTALHGGQHDQLPYYRYRTAVTHTVYRTALVRRPVYRPLYASLGWYIADGAVHGR